MFCPTPRYGGSVSFFKFEIIYTYASIIMEVGEYADGYGFLLPNPGFVYPECFQLRFEAERPIGLFIDNSINEMQIPKK